MQISVVNRSNYRDDYVQEVIRAVNRQLAEDVARHWHVHAQLRLEGPIGGFPDPDRPEELRGDAILYLLDDSSEDALGYHERNFRGIPFGVVFTELADALGEDWTVTFSHEALELAVDPEANRLVQGPHPEEPDRLVYHWYELCDAVQADTYEIDGIAVSNFVLPLYFTGGEEEGARNDFLGDDGRDEPLVSFGVAPGGYVGFFDPETGRHENFFAHSVDAAARLRTRTRAGFTRRTVRRTLETQPEPLVRRVLGLSPDGPLPEPTLENLCVDVRAGRDEDPYDVLDAAARAAIGSDWKRRYEAWEATEKPAEIRCTWYELEPREGEAPTPAEAWDTVYALRAERGVLDAEPEFRILRTDGELLDGLPSARRFSGVKKSDLPSSDAHDWSVVQIRADEAWTLARGAGVRVGHPDTGFFEHPEIWPGPIDTSLDASFLTDPESPDARAVAGDDDLLPGGPNHGTATASVIVSGHADPDDPAVLGVAPDAKLVPLRVENSVAHLTTGKLRRAIAYSAANGLDVVSMSLGSTPSRRLRKVVVDAARRGVILVAAAGNHIPLRVVVWPARYDEVVAVAACNADRRPWSGSSRGSKIDVTAPGESVWRAFVDTDLPAPARWKVERSSGTSYATAHVAGVAALWLSRHGPAVLRQKYGERLTDAFRFVVADTVQESDHLDPDDFGGGIIDAKAVLDHPLPSLAQVSLFAGGGGLGRRLAQSERATPARELLDDLAGLFPNMTRAEVRGGLEDLLGETGRRLDARVAELGDELIFHFATDAALRRRFLARCRECERLVSRGDTRRRWAKAIQGDTRNRLRSRASARLAGRLG